MNEPIQGFNNEYLPPNAGGDCPRCSSCEICLDGDNALAYEDYAMADVCGWCVLSFIDPDEKAMTECAVNYVDKYIEKSLA